MAEFHTLPIKTDDYLADTRHLTAAQHGAYFVLLMTAWRSADNALPNDDDLLARWACMDKRTWLRNRDVILCFWVLGPDARWRQKRLDQTRKYVDEMVNKKSAAGRASALKRKDSVSTPVQQGNQQNGNSESESESEIKQAGRKPDSKKVEPKETTGDVLPPRWQDIAEQRLIPEDQIFQSWRRFKDLTSFPYQLSNWRAWIAKERTSGSG